MNLVRKGQHLTFVAAAATQALGDRAWEQSRRGESVTVIEARSGVKTAIVRFDSDGTEIVAYYDELETQ